MTPAQIEGLEEIAKIAREQEQQCFSLFKQGGFSAAMLTRQATGNGRIVALVSSVLNEREESPIPAQAMAEKFGDDPEERRHPKDRKSWRTT